MRKFFAWVCVLLLAFPLAGAAELKVPSLTGRVVDKAGALSSTEEALVDGAIIGFESATGGQLAVLVIPSLDGDALDSFSMRVAEKWKLGYKGKDNGILLLVAVKEKKIRFEVGYGFEGQINDARAGDIIRGMRDYFRAGRFGDGIVYAVMSAQEMITGKKPSGVPAAPVHRSRRKSGQGSLIFVIAIIIVLNSLFRRRGRGGMILYSGGFRGGGFGGGFGSGGGGFSGGGCSGGGGSFGGGGASGGW
jgi:uncharacterized protein